MPIDTSPLAAVGNMPGPAKAGLAVLGGGGILAGVYALAGGNAQVVLIVAAGMVVISLLLVIYKAMLGWARKRRSKPLEQAMMDNAGAAPNSVSAPASRARMDELKRSFETGVQKFKDSGKNIYSLPWYLLVGEPGSGKTEAIRHCNVGFPPGLQDELQGAGGTINMNWWFTNHAIILDTAGRLMFEEVAPGATSEWREFLQLLSRVRPNCPVNGMMLVIPVDSLIRDTADAISKKAGKIAQQLDSIQRTLGVRFPVFIVITKCDLINGFREFFDGLNDPQLQHQILGWSNPNPLDTPFSPDQVEKHLKDVSAQLARRRQGLLLDPVNTEDPNGRRTDQVDALYSFPESLLGIAPRLRHYLEMVFVAGEWSPKPLFLRGIYFTSSMREGAALDKELADVLGVPVESLPEGKVWERDRAYFLRDLFVQKVFREKGLVTRASNTKKLQRQRKMAVMVTVFVAVIMLLGLTWFGKSTLDRSIGEQRHFWTAAQAEYGDLSNKDGWALIFRKMGSAINAPASYLGGKELRIGSDKMTRYTFHKKTLDAMRTPIAVPWVFKPLAAFSGSLNNQRQDAYRKIYETSVLSPLMDTVREKLKHEETWGTSATAALAQLVRLESYAGKNKPVARADDDQVDLDPLFRYALEDDKQNAPEYDTFRSDKATLQSAFKILYPKEKDGTWQLPKDWPVAGTDKSRAAVKAALDRFDDYWSRQAEGQSTRLVAMSELSKALDDFGSAEQAIAAGMQTAPTTLEAYAGMVDTTWKPSFTRLADDRAKADAQIKVLESTAAGNKRDIGELDQLFRDEVERIQGLDKSEHQKLLDQLPAPEAIKDEQLKSIREQILKGMNAADGLAAKAAPMTIKFADAQKYYLPHVTLEDNKRRYVVHFEKVYQKVNERLAVAAPAPESLNLSNSGRELNDVESQESAVLVPIRDLGAKFPGNTERITMATKSAEALVQAHGSNLRHAIIDMVLKNVPAKAELVEQKVAELVQSNKVPSVRHPRLPFTSGMSKRGDYAPEYNANAAKNYLLGWTLMGGLLNAKDTRVLAPDSLRRSYTDHQQAFTDYVAHYIQYWSVTVPQERLNVRVDQWSDLFSPDNRFDVAEVVGDLLDVAKSARESLTAIQDNATDQQRRVIQASQDYFQDLNGGLLAALQGNVKSIMSKWRALPDNPELARQQLVLMNARKFCEDYIQTHSEPDNVYKHYWNQLTIQCLTVLANQAQVSALKAKEKLLQDYTRFPLVRPVKDAKPMTSDEVDAARALLRQVSGSTIQPNPNAATIDEGGTCEDADVNEQLRKLRGGIDLPAKLQSLFAGMRRVAEALPKPGKTAEAQLSSLDKTAAADLNRDAGRTGAQGEWRYIAVFRIEKDASGKDQTPQMVGEAGTDLPTATALAKVPYPASNKSRYEIRMKNNPADDYITGAFIYPIQSGDPDKGGDWGILRQIFQPDVKRIPSDKGHDLWLCPVVVDNKVIWVKVEFDSTEKALPDVKDWPEAPKN